jgi:hypothetical protein
VLLEIVAPMSWNLSQVWANVPIAASNGLWEILKRTLTSHSEWRFLPGEPAQIAAAVALMCSGTL